MTTTELPEIPVEEYYLPQYAYLLERDHGTPERNEMVRDFIIHGVPFELEKFLSPFGWKVLQASVAELEGTPAYGD